MFQKDPKITIITHNNFNSRDRKIPQTEVVMKNHDKETLGC